MYASAATSGFSMAGAGLMFGTPYPLSGAGAELKNIA
jgi:hypothetical protein